MTNGFMISITSHENNEVAAEGGLEDGPERDGDGTGDGGDDL